MVVSTLELIRAADDFLAAVCHAESFMAQEPGTWRSVFELLDTDEPEVQALGLFLALDCLTRRPEVLLEVSRKLALQLYESINAEELIQRPEVMVRLIPALAESLRAKQVEPAVDSM